MASKVKTEAPTIQMLELASWWVDIKDTVNDHFIPLLFDESRYLVLKGGGGSGKSIFAGRKILERVTTEPGHRWLVCRKVAKTLRQSCFKQLCGQAREHYADQIAYIPKGSSGDMYMRFKNGSEILFCGLDDVEKLKSIYNITGVWIEEATEVLEGDFNQLDIRLRGETAYYKQMIITFNPVSILHWLKKRFFDRNDPRARVHESTYLNNRFLPEEDRITLESFKETDEYYYTVYCLGMWGIVGRSVFNAMLLTERLLQLAPPASVGMFEFSDEDNVDSGDFVEDRNGFIKIYEKPKEGYPYVIGADTAGNGSDSFVAQVINNTTGRQVAILRHTFDEDLFARQLYALGHYYNTALVAVETNFSTYPVLMLEKWRYPKLYVRESVDEYTHKPKTSFGFQTNLKTRPLAISTLVKAIREDVTLVCDRTTIEEMLTFVRDESFRPEAEEGAHDDCVMALAIAHLVRPHQEYLPSEGAGSLVEWTDSQWDDYRHASSSDRKMLLKIWGQPKKQEKKRR